MSMLWSGARNVAVLMRLIAACVYLTGASEVEVHVRPGQAGCSVRHAQLRHRRE